LKELAKPRTSSRLVKKQDPAVYNNFFPKDEPKVEEVYGTRRSARHKI
jgi:hypothetical protein